jgi:YaiO family outer membrane protein
MKKKLILLILFNIIIFSLAGQFDPDSLFRIAISQSHKKDYNKALENASKVLAAGERSDVLVFMANVHAWQEQFDSSKCYLERAFISDPSSSELYDSWLNVLLWDHEYEELLRTIEIARSNGYRNEYNIMLKKVGALKNLGRYSDAISLIDETGNSSFIDSAQIKSLYREMLVLSMTDFITAYYSLDYLNSSAQHLASLDYGHRAGPNSFLFRINYAQRYGDHNVQIESDFYHNGSHETYLYLNYGYSFSNIIFPRHRSGAEYYFHLKKGLEASIGGRYLQFSKLPVTIFTGSVSKYFGSSLLSLRPYYSISRNGDSKAAFAELRKYGRLPLAYWNIELGYGNSPDERIIFDQTQNYLKLTSYRFKLGRNFIIHSINELKLVLGYAYAESSDKYYFNRYFLEINFRLKP